MIKGFWKSLSLSKKLKLSYIAIVMIPLLLLGGYSYYSSQSFVQEQSQQQLKNAVAQTNREIENKIYQVESTLSSLVHNYSFQEFLASSHLSALEKSRMADLYIGPLLYNALLSNYYIDELKIFTDQDIIVLNDLIKPLSLIESDDWYKTIVSSNIYLWWLEDGHLYVGHRINNSITGQFLGVVRLKVKNDIYLQSFQSFVHKPLRIMMSSDDGENIFRYDSEQDSESSSSIQTTLAPLDWQIQYDFASNDLSLFTNHQLRFSASVILISLLIIVLMIHFLSRSLLKRIFVLTHQMQEVHRGELSTEIDTSYRDEIGSLALSFKTMHARINYLIKDKYQHEIQQKELELRLLQEKINPHFLYNILSTINWIAIEHNQTKISKMINDLATFYRTSLNQGKDMSTLKNELDNIKSYISLQQIAHEDDFEVIYDIDPHLLQLYVPNFIFQPIVENAIEHGVDTIRRGKGLITIRSQINRADFAIIIEDNGKELYDKFGEGYIDEKQYGYGLKNVNERIKIKVGAKYGIRLYADSAGTNAIVTLPYEVQGASRTL